MKRGKNDRKFAHAFAHSLEEGLKWKVGRSGDRRVTKFE